jgi:hypothetical protein
VEYQYGGCDSIYKICSHHDIAEIRLKLVLNTNQSFNQSIWWLIHTITLNYQMSHVDLTTTLTNKKLALE